MKLKLIILIILSWFIIHEVLIISDGLIDENETADVAVIFGNKVNEDGSLSERLKARLDRGVELYKNKKVSVLFVSGGLGKEGFYEGDKMYEYLSSKSIPKSSVVVDNHGDNTKLTASNYFKLFGTNKSVILVSQYHHISRAKLAFKNLGIAHVYGAHCNFFELRDIYSCIREFFGYYKYLLLR